MPCRLFLASLLLFASIARAQIPASQVWPLPSVPPGANPETIAMPREDWVKRVQLTMERTKGWHFDLIFDGDSITDGWQGPGHQVWNERYAHLNAFDFGIGGDQVENLLWRLRAGQVDGVDPKLVVLMIGTNNAVRDSADQIAEGIANVVAEYKQRCPHAHILLLGVLPREELPGAPLRHKVADVNSRIARLADDRVTFLDIGSRFLQPDGGISKDIMADFLHPTPKGYQIWADAIQPVIDKYLPPAKSY